MPSRRKFSTDLLAVTILLTCMSANVRSFEDTPAAIEIRQQESESQQTRLLPLLIARQELAQLRRQVANAGERQTMSRSGSPQPVSRPFIADLDLVYAIDNDDPAVLLSEGLLATWSIDIGTVHGRALANLRAHFGNIHHKSIAKLPWLHVIDSDDGYAASRLLLLEKWRDIALELGEPLIVGAPTRDVVVFTGSRDPQQIQQLRDTVETLAEHQGRPVSRQLFVWHPEGWSLLE